MTGLVAVPPRDADGADEGGAVLILYTVTMFVMLMMIAIVTDLGAMRADIRQTQSVSDMAATAGALSLAPEAEGTPSEACRAAWGYVLANVPTASGASDPCAPFVDYDDPPSCPETDQHVTAALGEDHEATIMWPVSDDVVGGTDSVIAFTPWSGGQYDTAADGPRCERLLVRIQRTRGFIFGNALAGVASGTVARPAVARGGVTETAPAPPVLVVLDPTGCETLTATGAGAGYIHVAEGEDDGNPLPGIITVDSDGSQCGSGQYTMDVSGNNAMIWAGVAPIATTPAVRHGAIESFALRTQWAARSYNPSLVNAGRLIGGYPEPKHPVASTRRTRQPWEHRYDCRAGYATTSPTHVAIVDCPEAGEGSGHISALRARVDEIIAGGVEAADYEIRTGNDCNIETGNHTLNLPGGKKGWYFDCQRLRVGSAARLTIPRGDVIIRGGTGNNDGLVVQGTLGVNTGSEEDDSTLVVRRGHLTKSGSGGLILGRPKDQGGGVFVYLPAGRMDVAGNDNQPFDWYAPYGDRETQVSGGCVAPNGGTPQGSEFQNLGLWSMHAGGWTNPQVLSGGVSNLNMEGIFYMPNSHFDFSGSGEMSQQKAQFVAYKIRARGNGTLRVAPDPTRMISECVASTALIR